jgi:hypothetical protein
MRKSILAALALVGVCAVLARSSTAADSRTYTGGRFMLDLAGHSPGFLRSFEGGAITADVIEEETLGLQPAKKHIAGVKYEDIRIRTGLGMPAPFCEWLAAFADGKAERRSGALVATDFDYKEKARRTFQDALITEVSIPALDAASKDPAYLSVKIAPGSVEDFVGGGTKVPAPASRQKAWLPSSFRLQVGDLPCRRVTKIDSFTIKQGITEELKDEQAPSGRLDLKVPGKLEIPNLRVTFSAEDVAPWAAWHKEFVLEGRSSDSSELDGAIVLLAEDGSTELARVNLHHVGIFSLLRMSDDGEAGGSSLDTVTVELYVERMELRFCAPAAN